MNLTKILRIRTRFGGYSAVFFTVGICLTLFFISIVLIAPLLQSWGILLDPTDLLNNQISQAPDSKHWFGTNIRGYDVFSRTLFGTSAALQVVLGSTCFSILLGVPLGLLSGYLGGRVDRFLLFIMDTLYTLPGLLLSVTLVFILGKGIVNVAIAVSIAYIPQYFRVVRNQTVSLKTELFVEAARAMGASTVHILTRYLFLNVIQSIPVLFTLNAADAVLVLGGLGFLGLGLPEEIPEWGHDLKEALPDLSVGIWWTTLFPGMALTFLVTGLSLLGESLSEFINLPNRD